ncbi:hypothetical protein JCM14076_16020 [Methylosoma difficile]
MKNHAVLLVLSIEGNCDDRTSRLVEKAIRETIVGKVLKNKADLDIVDTSKRLNRWAGKKEAYTVRSKQHELSECMGKDKVISNETVDCYYGK